MLVAVIFSLIDSYYDYVSDCSFCQDLEYLNFGLASVDDKVIYSCSNFARGCVGGHNCGCENALERRHLASSCVGAIIHGRTCRFHGPRVVVIDGGVEGESSGCDGVIASAEVTENGGWVTVDDGLETLIAAVVTLSAVRERPFVVVWSLFALEWHLVVLILDSNLASGYSLSGVD